MIGVPSSTNAILTVNSPLRLMNSFVPSTGSTIQHRFQCFLVVYSICLFSSLMIGIPRGSIIETISSLAFLSALVKGELSFFISTSKSFDI